MISKEERDKKGRKKREDRCVLRKGEKEGRKEK